ncbi:unnamed protein product [Symbiodinium sp. CCMP2592]|nr:unnamed protein product [Symbiodinium sp. CCMP2592]
MAGVAGGGGAPGGGAIGPPAMGPLTAAEIAGVTTLAAAKDLAGVSDEAWNVLQRSLGGAPSLRVLGSIPAIAIVASIRASRVPSPTAADPTAVRDFTILEATQLGLMWRAARLSLGLPDQDPYDPVGAVGGGGPAAAAPPAPAGAGGGVGDGARKVKMCRPRHQPLTPPLRWKHPHMRAPALTTAAQRRVSAAESGLLTGLASLDGVDLQDILQQRVLTLQGVPARLRGALRTALHAGLQLIADRESPAQELRGWKLFCLAPRMLLQRSSGESLIPPAELDRRCDLFARGVWPELLQLASGSAAPRSRTGMPTDDLAARASRATALVHIGELSAAGRALVAEPLAPGTDATLAELRDPSRRPPTPYAPLPQDIATYQAADPCPFPLPAFVACLRSARRGAAAGPSGATNEHLRILLDDEGDTQLLHRAACRLARADLPPPVLAALRVGRLTALQKPNGRGVRALVIGDVLRRLVGEGGEQGDPLMPALYALAQQPALQRIFVASVPFLRASVPFCFC